MKAITIPAHTSPTCRDVQVRCIRFVLPEDLATSGTPGSLCVPRQLRARAFANYIDTDFVCCDPVSITL